MNLAQHGLRTMALAEHHAGTWAQDGFLSSKRWLCHHTGLSAAAAATAPRQAKHVSEMPHTAAFSSDGVLSEPRLRLLVACHAADPELYDEDIDRVFNEIPDDRGVHLNDDGTIAPDGERPVDVGRASRNWPDAIANAIYTRDRHCRFPGCDIAANRCDIHHRTEWQHGGDTSTDNGLLLCRRHHRFLHANRWTIDRDERRQPVFRPPDGSTFIRPPSRRPTSASADDLGGVDDSDELFATMTRFAGAWGTPITAG